MQALRALETSKAEASQDTDRRRILNYIAHSYFVDAWPGTSTACRMFAYCKGSTVVLWTGERTKVARGIAVEPRSSVSHGSDKGPNTCTTSALITG